MELGRLNVQWRRRKTAWRLAVMICVRRSRAALRAARVLAAFCRRLDRFDSYRMNGFQRLNHREEKQASTYLSHDRRNSKTIPFLSFPFLSGGCVAMLQSDERDLVARRGQSKDQKSDETK
jgi:hypothetical protein